MTEFVLVLPVLLGAGAAAGFINTLASSSGSAVSLPLLVMLGMSEGAANATNRLPVLFGFLMALWTFHRAGQVDWAAARKTALPATPGSIAGGHLGARLSSHAHAKIWVFRLLVVVIVLELVHLGMRYFFVPYVHPGLHPWVREFLPFVP